MNILLIEQDEDMHDAIVSFLAERDCIVTACRTYDEATRTLPRLRGRSETPDAVVSRSDGLSFYVQARTRFPRLRWIVTDTRHQVAQPANPTSEFRLVPQMI
jgi:DNA-binding NtrC family response regulator